jgi:hypothetical protein
MLNSVKTLKAIRLGFAHHGRGIDELGPLECVEVKVFFNGSKNRTIVEFKPTLKGDIDLAEGINPST